MSEPVKVLECVIGGEIFELNEEVWEYFGHGFHEFVHEFFHLHAPEKENINN